MSWRDKIRQHQDKRAEEEKRDLIKLIETVRKNMDNEMARDMYGLKALERLLDELDPHMNPATVELLIKATREEKEAALKRAELERMDTNMITVLDALLVAMTSKDSLTNNNGARIRQLLTKLQDDIEFDGQLITAVKDSTHRFQAKLREAEAKEAREEAERGSRF